jgi:hypothetical protein
MDFFVLTYTANVHVVAGGSDELDETSLQMVFPETKVICIGEFR